MLVILGLLVGGVLTGQSLIRASELRAVTSEYQRYQTAVNAFRDKYFATPGDMTNASSFWTTLSAANNGNGDSIIPYGAPGGANTTGEEFQFWNMLALAGLIEGKYSGLAGPYNGADHVPGSNCPRSMASNAGWATITFGNSAGDTINYAADYGNYFSFGLTLTGATPLLSVIKPEEAWNIDTKMDDGRPSTGKILARENATWTGASTSKCTTSTSQTDYTGTYNLSVTGINCAIYFTKVF